MKLRTSLIGGCFLLANILCVTLQAQTYANPIDLPYRFQLDKPSRREAADPTMVVFRGEYWLFASKSGGYWHSKDLKNWQRVIPKGLPVEDYAPTVVVLKDRLYFTAFNTGAIYTTSDAAEGTWVKSADIDRYADPDLFVDDDGRLYLYSGCSNQGPLQVVELDPDRGFRVVRKAAIDDSRDANDRGWEVSGDSNDQVSASPWLEGSWMTKHAGRYYLQFAGPGTQFKSYADGMLISDSPMGPFKYAAWSPFSYKPSGFIAGAGHSSTFQDLDGRWWHISSMSISVRHMFERRLGLFPLQFLPDGELVQDDYLADYPHLLTGDRKLAGWMLLSYNKPATASSSLPDHEPSKAVDENIRDWWSAATGDPGEWLQVDLGSVDTVRAVQINYADEGSSALGIVDDAYRYKLEGSADGRAWTALVDRTRNGRDAPDDYEELEKPAHVRFVRITNVHVVGDAKFSISGLRVFGASKTALPGAVKEIHANRDAKDPRQATIDWQPAGGTEFYVVRYGEKADHLFKCFQVYDGTRLQIRSLNAGVPYFFTVDSVNKGGITRGGAPVAAR